MVDVLVHRLAGVDLVLDAVDGGHDHGAEGKIRIARAVRAAEFDALGLGLFAVHRNADRRRAVSAAVDEIDRGLVAGNETLVAVGRRVAEGAEGGGVFENSADGVKTQLRSGRRIYFRQREACRLSTGRSGRACRSRCPETGAWA